MSLNAPAFGAFPAGGGLKFPGALTLSRTEHTGNV